MNDNETYVTHEDFQLMLGLMEQIVDSQEAITETQEMILKRIIKATRPSNKNAEYRNK